MNRNTPTLRVLLVGNYPPDRQESMRRFAELLKRGLRERGMQVTTIAPSPRWFRWAGARANAHRGIAKWLAYADKFLRFPSQLQAAARGADIVHICDHSNVTYGRWVARKPWLVTCHDLLAVRSACGEFPENRTSWTGRRLQRWILSWLSRAPQIACVSEATARDAERLLDREAGRISTVLNGLNQPFTQLEGREDSLAVMGEMLGGLGRSVPDRFVFHVGGTQWYKNRDGVLELFSGLARRDPGLALLVAGKPANSRHLSRARSLGIEERTVFLGPVTDLQLEACYRTAEFLLFPSRAEGFGWPIIEAQACGCRVAASDRPPLPEVGGASVVSLPLEQPDECLDRLQLLLEETAPERQKRILLGFENLSRFDPSTMAERYAALYAEVLERDH